MRYKKEKVTFEKKSLSWESLVLSFVNNLLRDTSRNSAGHLQIKAYNNKILAMLTT